MGHEIAVGAHDRGWIAHSGACGWSGGRDAWAVFERLRDHDAESICVESGGPCDAEEGLGGAEPEAGEDQARDHGEFVMPFNNNIAWSVY